MATDWNAQVRVALLSMACFVVSGCARVSPRPLTLSPPPQVFQLKAQEPLNVEASFANAQLSILDELLQPHGRRATIAKSIQSSSLSGALSTETAAEFAAKVSILAGAPAEWIGQTLFVGAFPEDERVFCIFRAPSVSIEVLKAIAAIPEVQTVQLDEHSLWVRGSPQSLRRIHEAVESLKVPGASTVALNVKLVRTSMDGQLSYPPAKADLSAVKGQTILDAVFSFGSKFTTSATSIHSVPKKNVSPQGTVEIVGFSEIPVGFQTTAVCRDLGTACEIRLTLSDGDALDGKEPPTRSVNSVDIVAVVPYGEASVIGSFNRTALRGGLKLPLGISLGGTVQRYQILVQCQKAAPAQLVAKQITSSK